jgi:hypothetical protein
MAAPGKKAMCGGGGLPPAISIMARAFSAAAAAIRLLFSASDSSGDLKRKDGSIPGGIGYGESLKRSKRMLYYVLYASRCRWSCGMGRSLRVHGSWCVKMWQ